MHDMSMCRKPKVMIFTIRLRSNDGVPLEDITDDKEYYALLKGKNIFYVLSTQLDGPGVTKVGIAHDTARRGWNISRLRKYVTHYGLNAGDSCHGVRIHLLCTTTASAQVSYKRSTLVRLESALKKFYAKTSYSMKGDARGDERFRLPPTVIIDKVLELKTKLPHAITPAANRTARPRKAKRKAARTMRKAKPKKKKKRKKVEPKKWKVEKIVGTRPWEVQVKWVGYSTPTWENKGVIRKDLGNQVMDQLLDDYARAKARPRTTRTTRTRRTTRTTPTARARTRSKV